MQAQTPSPAGSRFGSANGRPCQDIERQEEGEATLFLLLLLLAASIEVAGRYGLPGPAQVGRAVPAGQLSWLWL